jgi:hypothetical protein
LAHIKDEKRNRYLGSANQFRPIKKCPVFAVNPEEVAKISSNGAESLNRLGNQKIKIS